MLILGFLAAAATFACPIEGARYVLRGAPSVIARFRAVETNPEWPSRIAFGISLPRAARPVWFLPYDGGSDGREKLASTTDVDAPGWSPPDPDDGPRPLGDLEVLTADDRYDFTAESLRRGAQAPAHLYLVGMSDVLWRRRVEGRQVSVPQQFFDRVSCGAR